MLISKNIIHNIYSFECYRPDGSLRWSEKFDNLVVDEGLNDLLSKWLKGDGYTAAWVVGLIDNAGYTTGVQADDTYAKITSSANPPTTNAWQELTAYDEGARQTLTLGSVSGKSVDNSAAKATFTINATKTIKGAFVCSTSVLLGGGAFTNSRDMYDNDTLQITITCTSASG